MSRSAVWAGVIVLGLAGCSGGGHTPLRPPVPVHGVLEMVGGPPGARPDPVAGRVTFVFDAGKGDVESVPVAADGSFSLELNPGRFQVSGSSPRYQGGKGVCRADGVVTVEAGMAPVRVLCQRR